MFLESTRNQKFQPKYVEAFIGKKSYKAEREKLINKLKKNVRNTASLYLKDQIELQFICEE